MPQASIGLKNTFRDVDGRLSAWHDNAMLMQRHAKPGHEAQFQNEIDNYGALVEIVQAAIRAAKGE